MRAKRPALVDDEEGLRGSGRSRVTAARTMLEAALVKLERQLTTDPGDYRGDLPRQFKAVAKQLRIDEERTDLDDNFKQVVRGLVQVVNGHRGRTDWTGTHRETAPRGRPEAA